MKQINKVKKIIIKPIISEKTLDQAEKLNKYCFLVNKGVSKREIAQEIAKMFEVKVLSVRIINLLGKKVRFGKERVPGQKPVTKKAIVSLKEGDSISVFKIK